MKKSIVIAGSLAQRPGRGGHAWVFLQYLLGFRRLGWDVLFLDWLGADMCINESGAAVPPETSWNVRYFEDVMRRFGLDGHYALLFPGGFAGLGRARVLDRVRASSALINVMGFLRDEEILAAAPRRVFLDIDPGFGQMWKALGLHDAFRGHDAWVTIGEHIGSAGCAVPTCGLEWMTTRQPIVLDEWPAVDAAVPPDAAITSVASWRGAYGPVDYHGTTYHLRPREFRKFAALPTQVDRRCELALDIDAGDERDRVLLASQRWQLVEPRRVAGSPECYADYVRRSAAELMIAKGMYVQTQSGWFSDRSICYLASGRPVLAQDTGLRDLLPAGEGLLTFSSLEEAAEAARAIEADYPRHSRAARRLAEECFDSSKVLGSLSRRLNLC